MKSWAYFVAALLTVAALVASVGERGRFALDDDGDVIEWRM